MFIRKQPTGNFTIIPNEVINSSISIVALGIYTKMRSKPKNWVFNINNMAKECGLNIKTFYKYLKELYDNNMIQRIQSRENGKFAKEVSYIFTESCDIIQTEIDTKLLQQDQIQKLKKACTDILKSENIEIPKNDIYNNTYSTKEEEKEKNTFLHIDLQQLLQSLKDNKTHDNTEEEFLQKLNPAQQEAYKKFIKYRMEKAKKILPATTKKAIQNKIHHFLNQKIDIIAVIEESILKGWTGLYCKQYHLKRKEECERNLFTFDAPNTTLDIKQLATEILHETMGDYKKS